MSCPQWLTKTAVLFQYYMAAKQYEKALKTALDVSPQNLGVLTPTLRAKIGHCLSKLGRLAEAEVIRIMSRMSGRVLYPRCRKTACLLVA
jgi:hypothetical protein